MVKLATRETFWTMQEDERLCEGLKKFGGCNWKAISEYVVSKSEQATYERGTKILAERFR